MVVAAIIVVDNVFLGTGFLVVGDAFELRGGLVLVMEDAIGLDWRDLNGRVNFSVDLEWHKYG